MLVSSFVLRGQRPVCKMNGLYARSAFQPWVMIPSLMVCSNLDGCGGSREAVHASTVIAIAITIARRRTGNGAWGEGGYLVTFMKRDHDLDSPRRGSTPPSINEFEHERELRFPFISYVLSTGVQMHIRIRIRLRLRDKDGPRL